MKNKAPQEVTINEYDVAKIKKSFSSGYQYSRVNVFPHKYLSSDTKYLSETHVEELIKSKDKEIRDLLKLVAERNAELSEKEREIESLKLEIARLSENNASLEFKISAKYKQGYRDGVKDWEDEHLKNN